MFELHKEEIQDLQRWNIQDYLKNNSFQHLNFVTINWGLQSLNKFKKFCNSRSFAFRLGLLVSLNFSVNRNINSQGCLRLILKGEKW